MVRTHCFPLYLCELYWITNSIKLDSIGLDCIGLDYNVFDVVLTFFTQEYSLASENDFYIFKNIYLLFR